MVGGSKTADWLVFDFAVATVPGAWTVWVHNDKSLVGGYSYLVYSNGNDAYVNEPKENKETATKSFYIADQEGNFITDTISANTKYTMYVHLGGNVDIDGIMIGNGECGTMYFANVRFADGYDQAITTNSGTEKMPLYTGDVETLGFEKGDIVQQMVTNDLAAGSYWWQTSDSQVAGASANLDRQTYKAYIAADGTQNSISIDFVVSEEITSGQVFYVWGEGLEHGGFGSVSVFGYAEDSSWEGNGGFKASIVDKDTGSPVNSLEENTVYTLSIYMPGATSYNVGSITASGMTTYFSLSSIRTSDADPISTDLGAQPLLLPEYQGDVTALGFEEGTTVFTSVQDSRTGMWNSNGALAVSMATQAITLTKAADEDYASVQFSVSRAFTDTYAFFTWWYDENGANQGGGGYLEADGGYFASGTTMTNANAYAFDLETGLAATSFVPGRAYELRWYGEGATKYQLACCEANSATITIYYANASSGNDVETTGDVVYDTNGEALQYYYGDVTKLGFAEGTAVYGKVEDNRTNAWASDGDLGLSMAKQAVKLTKTGEEDYASVLFSVSRNLTGTYAFFAWCTLADGTSPASGMGYLKADGTFAPSSTPINGGTAVAYDLATGEVATSFVPGKAYEMRWYGDTAVTFKIGCCEPNGIVTYYANPTSGNDA